jgi:16S rRNA (adenine1518-N6/adenine1519-N6)-dimethyltransferase
MSSPPRQTYTYLRKLFDQNGVAPNRRYGQNFLVDLNIHDLIVETARLDDRDVVLEVGPGTGALTTRMAELAAAVVAVEIDAAMARLTSRATEGRPNVRVLNRDALAGKHKLAPELVDNVRSGLAGEPGRRLKLVANLPYSIATPLISNLLVHPELHPELIVITIQKELADRMVARPSTNDYGSLSVLIQAMADVEIVRVLSPKVFWPRPKVDSAIVKITPDPARIGAIADLRWFHFVSRELFLMRRKNLRGVLHARFRKHWSGKPDVDAFLETVGLLGEVRAEALDVPEIIHLAEALRARFGAAAEPGPGADEEDEEEDEAEAPDEAEAGEEE